MQTETHCPPLNVAVFARGDDIRLVRLDDNYEGAAADVAAMGFDYVGSIGVNNGEPRVECEPGCAVVMYCAGLRYAEMLGPILKEYQLNQLAKG